MPQINTSSKAHARDDKFYWESVVFLVCRVFFKEFESALTSFPQVEGALFKLPKLHLLEGSETFSKEYGLVDEDLVDDEAIVAAELGVSQYTPVIPLSVSTHEFRSFLSALYPNR